MTRWQWKESRQGRIDRGMRKYGFPFVVYWIDNQGRETDRQVIGDLETARAFVMNGADKPWWVTNPPERSKRRA